jgi:uncharacterized NAD(P)/FAD-binding protein YdhS
LVKKMNKLNITGDINWIQKILDEKNLKYNKFKSFYFNRGLLEEYFTNEISKIKDSYPKILWTQWKFF